MILAQLYERGQGLDDDGKYPRKNESNERRPGDGGLSGLQLLASTLEIGEIP